MNLQRDESSAVPAPEVLEQIVAHIYQVAIFRAAVELQVWAQVEAGEDSAEAMAAAHHWDPLATRLLLDDLCTMKLLVKDERRYHLVPEAEWYLLPDKATYMGEFMLWSYGWEGNGQLEEGIRAGKRPLGDSATSAELIDIWMGMYARQLASPETYLRHWDTMWQELGIEPRAGLQVLDVACGPVPRSFALAQAHPGVRVTLLDWEQMLTTASKVAADLDIQSQVTLLPGDLWSVPYPANRYDVIYLGNIVHFFSPEQNTRLLRKAREALREGGTLVVNAMRSENPDPKDPGLWYFARSEGGAPYCFHEYKDMLERAGFSDVVDVSGQPIRATKRS
jgi:ubiquinone/menaquinone biosynthesis C-methylase UbiE